MSRVTRGAPAGDAYLDLQNQARRSRRPTDELHHLYALEGFLARLAASPVADSLVLKGGLLLAAFDARRPTRDVDLEALAIDNGIDAVLDLVREILATSLSADDGLEFDLDSLAAETIRDEDEYAGVRVNADARLATARLRFHVDVNVGDPVWPAPTRVLIPRLRGGPPLDHAGYPLHMVHAEKIITAVQRGTANTRWRDFADVYTLARAHSVDGMTLHRACLEVAAYRKAALGLLPEVLDGYAESAQTKWSAWRRRHGFGHLPEDFGAVLSAVVAFVDPVLAGAADGLAWDPESQAWQ
jgi:hypothetical protein